MSTCIYWHSLITNERGWLSIKDFNQRIILKFVLFLCFLVLLLDIILSCERKTIKMKTNMSGDCFQNITDYIFFVKRMPQLVSIANEI